MSEELPGQMNLYEILQSIEGRLPQLYEFPAVSSLPTWARTGVAELNAYIDSLREALDKANTATEFWADRAAQAETSRDVSNAAVGELSVRLQHAEAHAFNNSQLWQQALMDLSVSSAHLADADEQLDFIEYWFDNLYPRDWERCMKEWDERHR